MASSTTSNTNNYLQYQDASHNQFVNRTKCLAIDGSSTHLTNALQVVTEALSSTENVPKQSCSGDSQSRPSRTPSFINDQPAQIFPPLKLSTLAVPSNRQQGDQGHEKQGTPNISHSIHPTYASDSTSECQPEETQLTSNSSPVMHFPTSESIRTQSGSDPIHPQAQTTSATGKTIVASDSDVSNGFVKDGKMLPYVFEANEAGE